MRLSLVFGVIGQLLRLFSLAFLPPLILAAAEREYSVTGHFAIAMVASAVVGSLLARGFRRTSTFRRSEAMGIVAGTWLVIGHFAAIPYVFAGLSPVDALFESISGFTTTGATILTDFEQFGRPFFVWRAMTQWFGGLGVIALFVVVLPRLGIAGRQLFFAEASGAPSDSIAPQIRSTAQRLWILYLGLTAIQFLALLLVAKMPVYESVCHSLTTLAAGGFSPDGRSIAGYGNPAAEWIITFFMVLAGSSFTLQYKAFTRNPLLLFRDGEFRFYFFGMLVTTALLAFLLADGIPGLDDIRSSGFQITSLMSSTGFASTDYNEWKDSARVILILVMIVGGCAGSAAGGPKSIRYLLVGKFLKREIKQVLHPRAVMPLRYGRRVLPEEVMRAVFTLVVLYLAGYLLLGIFIALTGQDFVTAFSVSIACLGNIGPGFGPVGPMGTYAEFSDITKLVLTLAMWIGRLEIVTVLALLHPDVWRNLRLGNTERTVSL